MQLGSTCLKKLNFFMKCKAYKGCKSKWTDVKYI